MEAPRLGVELELQLPAYAIATAAWDLSHICDRHHSSWQCWILNPLSGARDPTHHLLVPSKIHSHCTTMGIPRLSFIFFLGPHPWHMEVPRLGVELELQLLA